MFFARSASRFERPASFRASSVIVESGTDCTW